MIRIGTVGTSRITERFVTAVRMAGGAEAVRVFSRTAERAASFAAEQGIPSFSADRRDFLSSPDLDVIYVAAPNSLHFSWALEALTAGKHVILEKPFTSNLREARALVSLAKEKGLFLFEGISTLHLPAFALAAELLPGLGKIRSAEASLLQRSSRYDALLAGRMSNVFDPAFSGGALMDMGVYPLDLFTGLFGRPDSVSYEPVFGFGGTDVSGTLTLCYGDLRIRSLTAKDRDGESYLRIEGEKGTLELPGKCGACSEVRLTTAQEGTRIFRTERPAEPLVHEVRDFVSLLERRDFSARDRLLELSLTEAEVLDRARSSAGIRFPADGE